MNGVTAKTLAGFLGLPTSDWDDVSEIPADEEARLLAILEWFNDAAFAAVEGVEQTADEQERMPREVRLSRYRDDESAARAGLDVPASCHAALQGYILALLAADGYAVTIDYVQEEK